MSNCIASPIISRNVTITYGSLYGLLLIIVSIYSFRFLMKFDDKFQKSGYFKRLKLWISDVWKRKSCYIPLIAHLFDQITDIAVAIQFYELAQNKHDNEWEDCNGLNIWYLFILTILSMTVYRVISSYLIYVSTKSIQRVILQILDLELFRTLYINYLCNKTEACDPQRWLTALEAALESSPQTIIQLIFLLKANRETFDGNYLIIISILSSFWSIISKLMSDDKIIVIEKAKKSEKPIFTVIHYIIVICLLCLFAVYGAIVLLPLIFALILFCCGVSCDMAVEFVVKPLNKISKTIATHCSYALRAIWRIFDVSSHILIMVYIWMIIGGISLTVKVVFESILFLYICIKTKKWELLFALIALPAGSGRIFLYRIMINCIFLILITIWLYNDFECPLCIKYVEREQLASDGIIVGGLIYIWIALALNISSFIILLLNDIFDEYASTSRDLKRMIETNNIDGILEIQLYGGHYGIYDKQRFVTLLMLAMRENKVAVIGYLLDKLGDEHCNEIDIKEKNILDWYCDGHDPDRSVYKRPMTKILNEIYEKVPKLKDKEGRNAILCGCWGKEKDIIDIVIKLDEEIILYQNDKNGKTFCDYLWEEMDKIDCFQFYQQYPNFVDINGGSPFFYQCQQSNKDNIDKLLRLYPNLIYTKDVKNRNVLNYYMKNKNVLQNETIMYINKLDPFLKSPIEKFSLFLCVSFNGNIECMKQIIELNKNVLEHTDCNDFNAITIAELNQQKEAVDYLQTSYGIITHNVSIDTIDDRKSNILDDLLSSPDPQSHLNALKLQYIFNKDEKLRSIKHHYTPFLCACYMGNLEAIKKLIDINDKVKNDKVGFDIDGKIIAKINNQKDIINYLGSPDSLYRFRKQRMSPKNKRIILILGPGNAGKSVFFRHFKMKFERNRLFQFQEEKDNIISQTVNQMKVCLNALNKIQSINQEQKKEESKWELTEAGTAAVAVIDSVMDGQIDQSIADAIKTLWNEEAIKGVFNLRNKKYRDINPWFVSDTAPFFWSEDTLNRMIKNDYKPSNEDILLHKYRTSGVKELRFNIGFPKYHIFDCGGSKMEREKWKDNFGKTILMIFVVSLSSYDEIKWDDDEQQQNAMVDSLKLFYNMINNSWFLKNKIVLILNKLDLFEKKIKTIPITECVAFKDYNGDPKSIKQSIEYIKNKFKQQNILNEYNRKMMDIHVTNATDKKGFDLLFTKHSLSTL